MFFVCSGCSRHVRMGDPQCPFCGAEAPADPPRRPLPRARLGRAALVAFGAAALAGACSEDVTPSGPSGTTTSQAASTTGAGGAGGEGAGATTSSGAGGEGGSGGEAGSGGEGGDGGEGGGIAPPYGAPP